MTSQVKIDDLSWNIQQEGNEEMNKITGIVAGQYGVAIPLTVVDRDGQAIDLSAYTAALVEAVSPDAKTSLSWTGTITTATGGLISFTPDSTNPFTRDGDWLAQVQFSDTGILSLTVPFLIPVERQI